MLTPANATKDDRNMPLCRRGDLAALWREQGLGNVAEEALTTETGSRRSMTFWTPCKSRDPPHVRSVALS